MKRKQANRVRITAPHEAPDTPTRLSYTWHLRPPFAGKFDRSHWWVGRESEPIKPISALYELARRDPRAGKAMLNRKPLAYANTPSLHFLSRCGLKSWPLLSPQEQHLWKRKVGSMKGLDFRDAKEQCVLITKLASEDVAP